MATLQTHDLTKAYGGRTVVRGGSLNVSSGEVVGLLGPNGAGKTTTFYMTVGLTAPDSGRVTLERVPIIARAGVDLISVGGMGRVFINALQGGDAYVLEAWMIVAAVIIIFFNLVADMMYAVLDPRIRLS